MACQEDKMLIYLFLLFTNKYISHLPASVYTWMKEWMKEKGHTVNISVSWHALQDLTKERMLLLPSTQTGIEDMNQFYCSAFPQCHLSVVLLGTKVKQLCN